MKTQLRAVEKGELIHPRELSRRIIREHAERQKGGLAQVHDENRIDLDHPAKALDVNRAVRSATWEAK